MKRKMKKKLNQAVACSLVSAMIFAMPVYAETGTGTGSGGTSAAAQFRLGFPDVPASHWAIKHITKLALQGIVQGDDLGRYSPENSVSQQDAVIMAMRMMGLEDEVKANTTAIALPVSTRDDARPYVAFAFEKGLLDLFEEEEAGFTDWGNRKATREWVAKIVIRALGKESDALAKANLSTPFADDSKIGKSFRGYINEAVSLGIVNGFDDNTFQPQGSVTRAQIATFFSRAEKYLPAPSDRVISGTLISMDGSKWTIQDADGKTRQVQIDSRASYYTYKDDTSRLVPSDVKLYYDVYIIHNQGTGYYVEVMSDQIPQQSIEGTLVSVDIDALKITIQNGGKYDTYEMTSNVTVLDPKGAGLSLGTLVPESIIELKRHAMIKDAKVTHINVKRVPVNKTVEGSFQAVDLSAMTISVKDKQTGAVETYPLTDLSAFTQDGKFFDPSNLYEGDIVSVEVKNDKAVGVKVVQQLVEKRDQGTLISLNQDNTFLTLEKAGKELASYFLSDNVQVIIEGNAYSTVKDLMPGDSISIEVNGNKITKIRVTSRSIENFTLATIVSYDEENKFLAVMDDLGNPKIYKMTDKTRVLFDDITVPQSNFKTMFPKGRRVNLIVSGSEIISIQIATRVDGTITQINPNSGDIMIRNANGVVHSYRVLSGAGVEKFGVATGKLSDLKVGDYVRAVFDGNQEQIIYINVRGTGLFRTVSKDANAGTITVQDYQDSSYTFSLRDIPIVNQTGGASIADIPLDEPIQLSFLGKNLEAVQFVSAYRGRVTSVDTASKRIVLTDHTNTSRVVDIGSQLTVRNGSYVDTSLFAVMPEQRVEIVKDASGATTVNIINGERRTVDSYDSSTKVLQMKRRTLNDKTSYPLHERAYVHEGDKLIHPSELKLNDVVTIYLLSGKIVEISK
jgi:hypothetical protein